MVAEVTVVKKNKIDKGGGHVSVGGGNRI